MTEIMKLKNSIHHLEGHVRELGRLENVLQVDDEPATAQEIENWKVILANIPGKAVVEVLLEYAVQEVGLIIYGTPPTYPCQTLTISVIGFGSAATL